MKNKFHIAVAASALLALGFAAAPAFGDAAADKIPSYVEIARGVFGGDKTSADVVAATLAAAADKGSDAQGTVGELAAALSAAEVAKDDPAVADALAGIVDAVNSAAGDDAASFASRAAATVSAVTGLDVASALADPAFVDAAADPDSVLSGAEKADLKDLYEKVLAALKGGDYAMKEDGDKATVDGKGKKGGKKGGKDKGDKAAAAAGAAGAAAAAGDAAAADGSDAKAGSDAAAGDTAADGGSDESVIYGDDENLGDPLDQTVDEPDAHEYKPTPTTISALEPVFTPPAPPVTTRPSSPSKPKPSPAPAEPDEPVYLPTGGTTQPSPTPVGKI